MQLRVPDLPDLLVRDEMEREDRLIKAARGASVLLRSGWDPDEHPRAGVPPNPGWFAPTSASGATEPEVAQADENQRELEEMGDPLAEVRQAQWDARVNMLRRLDPNDPNLVSIAPAGAPNPEAVARLDAEVAEVTTRVASKIANGHAWARHAAEFPELSNQSQFAGEIARVISNPAATVRALRDGRTAFYEGSTNTLVIVNPTAPDYGTAFRPERRSDYFDKLH